MNIVKSTGTFGFYTIISRLLGYFRDVLIAIFIGTSFLADVFFVAFRIPNTFRRLFAEGTFNAAFVPSYTSELVNSKSKAKIFANEIFNLLFLGLLFLVLVVELFMPLFVSLIAPGFTQDTDKIELAITLTRITFPFLMVVSLSSFFGAILNSHNKFAAASAAPIILNLVLIIILFFGNYLNDELIYFLSWGVSIAGLLQFIFLYKFVKKFYVIRFNFKIQISNKVKFFFKKLLPSIFSSGVTQINILVGTIIASFQASAVSYLYYADRIYQINLAIAGIAIGIVVLPQLSKHVFLKKKNKILKIQNKALEISMFLSLPASAALLVGSEEIISALFGYGSFSKEAVFNSSLALYYFGLGLPAFAFIKVFSTFFFANNDTKTPFYISVISVALNICISVYYFEDIGFIIIPIATTISSWFNSLLLFFYLKRRDLFRFNKTFLISFIKILFATILMSLFFKYLILIFDNQLTYEYYFKSFYLILSVFLGLSFYLILSLIIKAFKYDDIKIRY
jgi:putative peptidoglycan lipid II flippase